MAEVIRYVNTDSDGGNGTTNATTGANAAYATLSAWEAAEQTNLDTANNWMHVYVSAPSGVADTAPLTLFGWTTSAADYILIEPLDSTEAALASGWDTGRYRLEATDPSSENATFRLFEDYVRVRGLQIGVIYSSSADNVININNISAANDIRIYDCRIRGDTNASSNSRGIDVGDSDTILSAWNNIIYNCDHSGIFSSGTTNNVYNNTIYGCGTAGIWGSGASNWDIEGNVVFKNGDDFLDGTSGTWGLDTNASDDGDGSNPVSPTADGGAEWTTDFTGAATFDFTLLSGSDMIGASIVDPGSGLFSDDIAGTARGAAWDVGAFEFVAGALTGTTSDEIKFGDLASVKATFKVSAADEIKFGDPASTLINMQVSAVDGVKLGDTATAQATLLATAIDGLKIGDAGTLGATIAALAVDGIRFGDAPTVRATLNATAVDGINFGDPAARKATYNTVTIDGLKLGDLATTLINMGATSVDGVNFGDLVTGTMTTPGVITGTATDGIKFGDLADNQMTFNVTAVDGLKLGDQVSTVINWLLYATDGVKIGDAVTGTMATPAAVVGPVTITFTSSGATITFTSAAPGITYTGAKPTITFS